MFYKHGYSGTAEHNAWRNMRRRCYTKSNPIYHLYGGRGIRVCDRWNESFLNFLEDMGPRPSTRHTLERVNNNRGYGPENCCWATMKEQHRNTRRNRFVSFQGERLTLADWAQRKGLHPATLHSRLRRGWPLAKALEPIARVG